MKICVTRSGQLSTLIAGGVIGAVISAYAFLLCRASWICDEYLTIALLRDGGWRFFWHWSLTWSPRPWSNLIYAAYGILVNEVHRPLAGTCMALLWCGLACACLLPAVRRKEDRHIRVFAALFLLVILLVGHDVTEVFYWPAGGLSYVPTLAGVVWFFWCIADGLDRRVRRIEASAALILLAGCSEVGAFLALTTSVCFFYRLRFSDLRKYWWVTPGMAIAIIDLGLVLHGRVGTTEILGSGGIYVHHVGASLLAAVPQWCKELATPESEAGNPHLIIESAIARVMILVGARWTLGSLRNFCGDFMLPFAAALLLANFVSIFSALYQFGTLCCERHDTMRACFTSLAFVAIGAWSARRYPSHLLRLERGSIIWIIAVSLLFLPKLSAIASDYRSRASVAQARAESWLSGLGPGDNMVFELQPSGSLITSGGFRPGKYSMGPNIAWYNLGLLKYFKKKHVTIVGN